MSAAFDGVEIELHSHLCVFHRGRAERDDLLIPFLSDGLRRGDACQYFAVAEEEGDVERSLGDLGSRLQVHLPEERPQRGGTLDSDAILADLDDWSERAGTTCRVAGDMGWVRSSLRRQEQLDALFQHEVNAGLWVNRRPVYALCFYDLDVFDGDVIVPMVKAHPQIWMTGVLVDNPYRQQP
ncbi:MEDS domain-containing protein [Lentzea sp. NPDC051213]|uniref:MEDS domain-containing protein n=1 Tax=Lentzea sp. NPDC051213 TaxID=3364126 RepID=UPI0037A6BF89